MNDHFRSGTLDVTNNSGENLVSSVKALKQKIDHTQKSLNKALSPRRLHEQLKLSSRSCEMLPEVLHLEELSNGSGKARSSTLMPDAVLSSKDQNIFLINSTRDELNSLIKEKENLYGERNQLLAKLQEAHDTIEELSGVKIMGDTVYQNKLGKLQEQIVLLSAEVRAKDQSASKLELQLATSQREMLESNRRVNQCNEILKATEDRMREQQAIIKQLREEKNHAIQQVEQYQAQVTLKQTVMNSFDGLQKRIKNLVHEKATLQKQFDEQSENYELLQSELSDKKELKKNLEYFTQMNCKLNEQVQCMKDEVLGKEARLNKMEEVNAELNSRITGLHHQLNEQEVMWSDLEITRSQYSKDIERLRKELDEKNNCIKLLQDDRDSLEKAISDVKTRCGCLEDDLRRVEKVKMENIELKCQLDETQRKFTIFQTEMNSAQEQLVQLEALANTSKDTQFNARDHQTLIELRKEMKEKTHEIHCLREALEEKENELKVTQQALESKEKVQKKSEKAGVESEKTRLQLELNRLKERLAEQETREAVMSSRFKELEAETGTLRKRIESNRKTIVSLKQQKQASESEIKNLKDSLSDLRKSQNLHDTEIEEQHAITERLQRKVNVLQQELENKKAERESAVQSLKEQYDDVCSQLSSAQKQKEECRTKISKLQAECLEAQHKAIKDEMQIELKHKEAKQLATDLENEKSENKRIKEEFLTKIQICERRISQLEEELEQAGEENSTYKMQVKEMKLLYESQIREKENHISEYATRLKSLNAALEDSESRFTLKENELLNTRLNDSVNVQKVVQLEEQHSSLSHQLHDLETTLKKMQLTHEIEVNRYKAAQEKLNEELRCNKAHYTNQVKDLERDKACLLSEVKSFEERIKQSSADSRVREEQLKSELSDAIENIRKKSDDINALEQNFHHLELELERQMLINTQFEGEFKRAQNDLKCAMSQLEELQELLSSCQDDKNMIESRLVDTERLLKRSHQEVAYKATEIEELEEQISSQARQLMERAQQVSQLDVLIKTYKADMEVQLQNAKIQVQKHQQDKELTSQQISQIQEEVRKLTSELEIKEKAFVDAKSHAEVLEFDLSEKSQQITELQSRLDRIEDKSQSMLHTFTTRNQEIEAKNELIFKYEERLNSLHQDLVEAVRQKQTITEQYNHSQKQLQEYLDTIYDLEHRLIHIEKSKTGVGSQALEEARQELQSLQMQHRKEIARLDEAHANFLECKQEIEANCEAKVKEVEANETKLRRQLEMCNNQIEALRSELHTRLELLKSANEAVVIKEAEVARLEAKLSGIERKFANYHYSSNLSNIGTGDALEHHLRVADSLYSPLRMSQNRGLSVMPTIQTVTRALFSSSRHERLKRSKSVSGSIDFSNFSEDFNQTGDITTPVVEDAMASDPDLSLMSRDDTLTREREELFARLDKLNQESVETMARGDALAMGSAVAENDVEPVDEEASNSDTESLCTVKQVLNPAQEKS